MVYQVKNRDMHCVETQNWSLRHLHWRLSVYKVIIQIDNKNESVWSLMHAGVTLCEGGSFTAGNPHK